MDIIKTVYSGVMCEEIIYDNPSFKFEKDKDLVTVSVTSYNSSKFIEDTLESIKEQSYHNITLQISDDHSTDDTIEICKKWIDKNLNRFLAAKIIVPEKNTGVSANCNRGWDACKTVWYKDIAGDDILLPNCIQDNLNYMKLNPDTVVLFSRMKVFGATLEYNKKVENNFDLSFFKLDPEMQLLRLLKRGNCLPAPTIFYNLGLLKKNGIRHDERIPLLEDYPKWINLLRNGIKFHFMDSETVLYRISENALSTQKIHSPKYFNSLRSFYFLYLFDDEYRNNKEETIANIVNYESREYARLYEMLQCYKDKVKTIENSYTYRIGAMIIAPIHIVINLFKNILVLK